MSVVPRRLNFGRLTAAALGALHCADVISGCPCWLG